MLELMAQVRLNGKVALHWQIATRGGKIFEDDVRLTSISKLTGVLPFKLRFQAWSRDVQLRRNMTSSKWYNGLELLTQREFVIFKDGTLGENKPEELIAPRRRTRRRRPLTGAFSWSYRDCPLQRHTWIVSQLTLGKKKFHF